MKNLLKTAAIAAIFTGFANSASALENSFNADPITFEQTYIAAPIAPQTPALALGPQVKIGVARLDGGRLIPTPYAEEYDWKLLAKRTSMKSGAKVEVMNAGDYLKYIPLIDFFGIDTDNKIDEIRLAAANEGYSHVIIYGMEGDVRLGSFGGKTLERTGLVFGHDSESWKSAKAKALIIDSFTGDVLGTAKADDITYNIGKLADDVERVMLKLNKA